MYSQLNDDQIIERFFGSRTGRFLDIGANNGITFSNSRALFDRGWEGVLVEPDPGAFFALLRNYPKKTGVHFYNVFVDTQDGVRPFHICNDSLLSTGRAEDKAIWTKQEYADVFVSAVSVARLLETVGFDFQFVSLDAEGLTFDLLKAFPLAQMNTELWCVEYDNHNYIAMKEYMGNAGYAVYDENALNLFFARRP
ncbi:MAG TPA: FkbM family methyltransferase [Syntrophales bacterium]|nr:FkbM family methyltransferase [Syntrophales bacterium]HRT88032.1 FkbM family methyltransferase [Anaerohalosphaeraceae bacterium]